MLTEKITMTIWGKQVQQKKTFWLTYGSLFKMWMSLSISNQYKASLSIMCKVIFGYVFTVQVVICVSFSLLDTVVSYQNESFSSKWELPLLPPSSLELWRKERAGKAALILMKNSQFDRTLRYMTSSVALRIPIAQFYCRSTIIPMKISPLNGPSAQFVTPIW